MQNTYCHTHTSDRGVVIRPDLKGACSSRILRRTSISSETKALRTLISINMRRVDALRPWAHLDEGSDLFTASVLQNQHKRIQPRPSGRGTSTHHKHRRLYQPSLLGKNTRVLTEKQENAWHCVARRQKQACLQELVPHTEVIYEENISEGDKAEKVLRHINE